MPQTTLTTYYVGAVMTPGSIPRVWPIVERATDIIVALATSEDNAQTVVNALNQVA